MQMDWDIDHPIKEHAVTLGDRVMHIYYFVSDDRAATELEGVGEVEVDEKHIHLLLHDGAVYLLRTDGKFSRTYKHHEEGAIDLPSGIAEVVGPYIQGYEKDRLLPIMCAPMSLQLGWYDYFLRRRRAAQVQG